jgi:hypothetical protein
MRSLRKTDAIIAELGIERRGGDYKNPPQTLYSTTNVSTHIDINDPEDQDDHWQKQATKTRDKSRQKAKKHKKY